MANFPATLDVLTDPTSGNFLSSPSHSAQHQTINAIAQALEAKVGVTASTPSAGKVLKSTGAGLSAWAQVDPSTDIATMTSATLRGLLTDETGSGAAVFANTPTIISPAITTGGSWAGNPTITGQLASGGVLEATTFIDQNAIDRDITIPDSHDYVAVGTVKVASNTTFKIPSTSTVRLVDTSPGVVATTGWQLLNETWVYASATTITAPAGAANRLQRLDKVSLIQDNTLKYFLITGVTDTVLTITGGTSYTLTNSAISNVSISRIQNPFGYPSELKNYNPYRFCAYLNSAQNTINGQTKVLLNAELYDRSSSFDSVTNNRFTALVAGAYHFSGTITCTNAAAIRLEAHLYKNGADFMQGVSQSADTFAASTFAGDIELAIGEYVELFVASNGANAIKTGTAPVTTFMCGHLVGEY